MRETLEREVKLRAGEAFELPELGGEAIGVVGGAAADVMRTIKTYLESERPARSLGRVSLVLATATSYRAFQEALFSTFPDES